MTLEEYVDANREQMTRHAFLKQLSEASGVSVGTLTLLVGTYRMDSYSKAKRISEATDGAVTVEELCR